MQTFVYSTVALVAGLAAFVCAQAEASTFKVLHAFAFTDPGFFPTGDLVIDPQGNVIGTTSTGSQSGTIFRYTVANQSLAFLYNFLGTDGSVPQGSLVLSGSSLYGTAGQGGAGGAGTVYRLDLPTSRLTTLHDFEGKADGASPYGGLTARNGVLFGVTLYAGARKGGTLYAVPQSDPSPYVPNLTTLYAFNQSGTAPDGPVGDVAIDASGTVYGVTEAYGDKRTGAVYSYDPASGAFTVLHAFTDKSTGSFPFAGVTLFGNAVYGTTFAGGAHDRGTVWEYDLAARNFTVLHSFAGKADGQAPQARLAITRNGVLYGTAYKGGAYDYGTVFKMSLQTGKFVVLHDFQNADGQYPLAGVVVGKDGTIYGTASLGGAGIGTLFSIAP